MNDFTEFEKKLDELRRKLDEIDRAREELLKLSREMKRKATLTISSIHANRVPEAKEKMEEAEGILEELEAYRNYEIFYPITREAMQELVEAAVFLRIVSENRLDIPDYDIHPSPILTGLADAVGELRRYTLDLLRKSKIEEAERLIGFMEKIYFSLIAFSYPDKVVPGLRGKIDMMRLSLERTKSDLISAMLLTKEKPF
jgi:translin